MSCEKKIMKHLHTNHVSFRSIRFHYTVYIVWRSNVTLIRYKRNVLCCRKQMKDTNNSPLVGTHENMKQFQLLKLSFTPVISLYKRYILYSILVISCVYIE